MFCGKFIVDIQKGKKDMQVVSGIIEIPNTDVITSDYIEQEFTKLNINPLRWAIVHVSDNILKVNVSNLKEQEV